MTTNRRIAVAVSGSGRSLANFLAQQAVRGDYEVAGVIASRPDCRGVDIARDAKLPVLVEEFTASKLEAVGERLYTWLDDHDIALVTLAGFLKLFPLHRDWERRVVNIHPALLPAFGGPGMYGDRVHAAVLAAGSKKSGASVHFVDANYDEGDLIAQSEVPVAPDDTASSLAARVFAAECALYPEVVARLLDGRLPLADGVLKLARVPS